MLLTSRCTAYRETLAQILTPALLAEALHQNVVEDFGIEIVILASIE